jgi:hypothetical protein
MNMKRVYNQINCARGRRGELVFSRPGLRVEKASLCIQGG